MYFVCLSCFGFVFIDNIFNWYSLQSYISSHSLSDNVSSVWQMSYLGRIEFSPPLSLLVKNLGTKAGAKHRHVPPLQVFLEESQES